MTSVTYRQAVLNVGVTALLMLAPTSGAVAEIIATAPLPAGSAAPQPGIGAKTAAALPGLGSAVAQLYSVYRSQGTTASERFAASNGLTLRHGRVTLELRLQRRLEPKDVPASLLESFGAEVTDRSDHFLHLTVPLGQLSNLGAALERFGVLKRPVRLRPAVTSEGIDLTGGSAMHDAGYSGTGVRIGMVDIGYNRLDVAQDSGEAPADAFLMNFTGEDILAGNVHGAACTEIVYDYAPDADYYIAKVFNDADFENAVDSLIAIGVDVMSMSIGWDAAMGDYFQGGDPMSGKVNEAFAAGILVVCSAGNSAESHYRADFDDQSQAGDFHRFADGVTVNHFGPNTAQGYVFGAGTRLSVSLAWDDFPESGNDYDLYMYRWNGHRWLNVASSQDVQNGNDEPVEYIDYTVNTQGIYGVGVHNYDGDDGINFTLFGAYDFAYRTPAGSVIIPALAADAYTAAAVDYADWNAAGVTVESFSSQGPTYDGRTKPDVAGPDGVTSFVYDGAFYGTSAAAPHVAGAAALLKANRPALTCENLRDYLSGHAVDKGDAGKDNLFGWGELFIEPISTHVYHVPDDYDTIQEAVDDAGAGDSVIVRPGTYVENLSLYTKRIVLGSMFLTTGDPAYIDSTVIDGNNAGPTVNAYFARAAAVLSGLTITGGSGLDDRYGGGIYASRTSMTIDHCRITGNKTFAGGGIYGYRADITLSNCTLSGDTATGYGGGIAMLYCDPVIDSCEISGNVASKGGGMHLYGSNPVITRTAFTDNAAATGRRDGGGLYAVVNSAPTLDFVTFSGNSATRGGGMMCFYNATPVLTNSIMYGDSPQEVYFHHRRNPNTIDFDYCDIEGGAGGVTTNDNGTVNWGAGNLDQDPLFADAGAGDYTLTALSPCIDAGDAAAAQDPDGTRADMGVFYYDQGGMFGGPRLAVDPATELLLPLTNRLDPAFPNPFNAVAHVPFALRESAPVRLAAFDLQGRRVATLVDGVQEAGYHIAVWNAAELPAGMYLVRLEVPGRSSVRRLVLVK